MNVNAKPRTAAEIKKRLEEIGQLLSNPRGTEVSTFHELIAERDELRIAYRETTQ